MALGLMVAVCSAAPTRAHAQAAQAAPAAPAARVFASDAGMVLNFIKADKTGDFEAVITKLKEALQKSDKPERKQQATGWKVFKSADPAQNNQVLYVFVIDPPVKGADYTVSTILNEGFPQEVQALYKQYAEAYATGQNFLNLSLVSDLAK
jgi:pyruvate/2-oxoglutarate dehydrogenase complex dihydrolipoamide acyltransferase (E2) component